MEEEIDIYIYSEKLKESPAETKTQTLNLKLIGGQAYGTKGN